MPTLKLEEGGNLSIARRLKDTALNIFGPHETASTTSSSIPVFDKDRPWRVNDVRVEGRTLNVDIQDSTGKPHTLKLPSDQVQTVQYVNCSGSQPKKRLYTQIRRGSKTSYFQAPPTVFYLGDVLNSEWDALERKLDQGRIGVSWSPTGRSERIEKIVPDAWEPDLSY